jgi:hypothetical protein
MVIAPPPVMSCIVTLGTSMLCVVDQLLSEVVFDILV